MARLFAITVCLLLPALASLSQESPPYDVAPWPLEGHRPQPLFPEIARVAAIKGTVDARVFVDEGGSVDSVRILNETSARLGFAESVKTALYNWKFNPASYHNSPVCSTTDLTFVFLVYHSRRDSLFISQEWYWKNNDDIVRQFVLSANSVVNRREKGDDLQKYIPPPIVYMPPPPIKVHWNDPKISKTEIIK